MEKKIRIVGMMDNKVDNTLESANRVYDKAYCCPTVNTCQGGGRQPKVIRKIKVVAMRGREGGATVRATERWNEQHNNNGNKG